MRTLSADAIAAAVERMAQSIADRHADTPHLVLAGIANGGVPFAKKLQAEVARRLGRSIDTEVIDISFHRDDIGKRPIAKEVQGTTLQRDPEEAVILLVDDVVCTGRTVRAAMDEIHSIGRPRKIELAALVDRGNRKLPIQPDYTGLTVETDPEETVEVDFDPDRPERCAARIRQPDSV